MIDMLAGLGSLNNIQKSQNKMFALSFVLG